MTNIAKLENLFITVSAERGKSPMEAIKGIISILRVRSDRGEDHLVVPMMKKVFLELAMEDGVEADFSEFCLTFITRINQEFNILLN